MSTTVVPAPAAQAKRPVRSDKPANQAGEQQIANEDEESVAHDDSEGEEVSVAAADEGGEGAVTSETSLAGDFTFGGALAEAASSSGSLISEAEEADKVGFSQFGDGDGSTILLVGALILVGLGIYVLADGGNDDDDVIVNTPPTISVGTIAPIDEDSAAGATITVTTTDPDGDTVNVTGTSSQGTVTKNANGTFTFKPNANFNGDATVTFTATDGTDTVTQTATVKVNAVNDAPTITVGTIAAVDEDSAVGTTFTIATADVENDAVTVVVTSANGTVTRNDDGTYTFKPAADFNGTGVITVKATDAQGAETTQNVNVTVNSINDAAVLSPLTVATDEDVALNLSNILVVTDVDGDDDAIQAAVTTQPNNGTITIDGNGNVIYTPDQDYNGPDTVGFTLTDDQGLSATYTVAINVIPVDDTVTVSIDVGSPNVAAQIDASTGDIVFTDNATLLTNANITGFALGDSVVVTNAVASDYNFSRSFNDINDLVVSFTDDATGATNTYVIQDILPDAGPVNNYASAVTAVGFDFMTFA